MPIQEVSIVALADGSYGAMSTNPERPAAPEWLALRWIDRAAALEWVCGPAADDPRLDVTWLPPLSAIRPAAPIPSAAAAAEPAPAPRAKRRRARRATYALAGG